MPLLSKLRQWRHKLSPAFPSDYRQSIGKAPVRKQEELRRYGTEYGGWWLPLDLRLPARPLIYSAGAGEDVSFEAALTAAFDCEIHLIDPTPRAQHHFEELSAATAAGRSFPINGDPALPYAVTTAQLGRMGYHALGIAGSDGEQRFYFPKNPAHVSCAIGKGAGDYFTARCLTLPSLLREFGHGHIDILKLDVEGAEYGILEGLAPGPSLPRYLCVEFHVPDRAVLRRLRRVHRRLEKLGYQFSFAKDFDVLFERKD